MILISRGAEPPALTEVRAQRLGEMRQAIARGKPIAFTDYDAVKNELARMQHTKCCYCEKREEQAKYRDVEHYRPKAYYWWLAWSWENLLFSCIDCNREHKRNQFPLEPGSTPLTPENAPPGTEDALILDPCDPAINPTEEMKFRPEKVQGKERWRPHGLTPRGTTTIIVCGLDRPALLDLYTAHVVDAVRPKLMPFQATLKTSEPGPIYKAWDTVRRSLLAPGRPFHALSRDALTHLVKPDIRTQYNLSLP